MGQFFTDSVIFARQNGISNRIMEMAVKFSVADFPLFFQLRFLLLFGQQGFHAVVIDMSTYRFRERHIPEKLPDHLLVLVHENEILRLADFFERIADIVNPHFGIIRLAFRQ